MQEIKKISDINLDEIVKANGGYASSTNNWNAPKTNNYTPSPKAWEDQVLYFMMTDRFSNNEENNYLDNTGKPIKNGSIPLFNKRDIGNAVKSNAAQQTWDNAGKVWCGGNLKGLMNKMGYLKRMGVTTIWLSPLFKQVDKYETYHGYGIQNFLEIDPNFGTKEELRECVKIAHDHEIYVILDIIFNHAGDIFEYKQSDLSFDSNKVSEVKGYRDLKGSPSIPFKFPVPEDKYPNCAIWPQELQHPTTFTRKGEIINSDYFWERFPDYVDGDFPNPDKLYSLKDIKLGDRYNYWNDKDENIDKYNVADALKYLGKIYSYWIAYADIDGYRIDTVKHMDKGATRYFTSVIHEFAQSIGKENFYLIGEISGGRSRAFQTMEKTGLNAALGINDIPGKLEALAKGETNPIEYFELFRHSLSEGKDSHTWFRNKVVTMFDDHDQIRKNIQKGQNKARFCFGNGEKYINIVIALNLLTEGIPCIYYGTEQGFVGEGDNDRYIRECMFGGEFGAFASKNRHFFDETNPIYKFISQITNLRKLYLPLKRGRQYLREISKDGKKFYIPQKLGGKMLSVVSWSRIFNNEEIIVAVNTDIKNASTVWINIDISNENNSNKKYLFSTSSAQIGTTTKVKFLQLRKVISIKVPAGGVVVLK